MSVYVLDSNFFIQAHRATYPLDVVQSFWAKVNQLAQDGKIVSIDKVRDELYHHQDDLKTWCLANLPISFFNDSSATISNYAQVAAWANSRRSHYSNAALNEFLSADEADAWLVAYAHADNTNRILVTHEVSQPSRKSKIKIPDACAPFDIRFVSTIEMFRQLGERF